MAGHRLTAGLSWWGIVRLGLVQSAIGAIAVLTTATLNRVIVVEMALPASLPAGLVAWHYGVQLSRPRWGHGSDSGNNRTSWILGGMSVLALGAVLAANATVLMAAHATAGLILGVVAFAMIGGGVAASGTSLLALMASSVAADRRPAAAAIAWVMMIVGIVLTAGIGGHLLDPYTPQRLVLVASGIAVIALLVTLLAVRRVESRLARVEPKAQGVPPAPFWQTVRALWREKQARDFTLFVFVSMLAYSAQELILEPYAGLVFGYSVGQSTQLAGVQHGGVLLGMVLLGLLSTRLGGDKVVLMKRCTLVGCLVSAMALLGLAAAGLAQPFVPLRPMVFALGFANGIFAVSALGLMMSFAGASDAAEACPSTGTGTGVRMGVWGAAQAGAFGIGGFAGATSLDVMRHVAGNGSAAFATVFVGEALVFVVAAVIASRLGRSMRDHAAAIVPTVYRYDTPLNQGSL